MILAAVSGGLDSVAMLWVLLTRDSEQVHVHHVSLRTKSGRWKAEDAAIAKVLPLLRRVRDFGYSESVYDPQKQGLFYDVTIVSRECARACRELGLFPRAYARGGAAHDENRAGIEHRRALAERAWIKAWEPEPAPEIVFPVRTMTRAQMWTMLPREIGECVWSCRRPQFDMKSEVYWPCGECRPCREFASGHVPHPPCEG